VNSNQLSDIGIMDSLVRLGEEDASPPIPGASPATLAKYSFDAIIKRYTTSPFNSFPPAWISLDQSYQDNKDSSSPSPSAPGMSMEELHRYALSEALMIHHAHIEQYRRGLELMKKFTKILIPNAARLFGPLTEGDHSSPTLTPLLNPFLQVATLDFPYL
jgi:hypothetical protein